MKRVLAAAALGLASTAAIAGEVPAAPVKVCGAVVTLTEASCIGVRSGGQTYEITSAKPMPAVGDVIVLTGTPGNAMGICMEGTHLSKITWSKVASCPPSHPTGY